MRALRRLAVTAATVACVAGTVAGCAGTVDGSGALGSGVATRSGGTAHPTPSGSGAPTGFPSSGASSSAAPAPLADHLIPPPSGSENGTSTWANTTSPTVEAFVQHFYDADQVTSEVTRLQADGITGVAHHLWLQGGDQFDVILLQFASSTGATTRHTGVIAATLADPTLKSTRPAIAGDVTEFYATAVDKLGNIASRAYAIKGDITVEVFCFSPKTFDAKDLTNYTAQQVAKLP
jgi:hypothetical protein